MVGPNGLEPSTSSVSRKRSNQTELRAYMKTTVDSILMVGGRLRQTGSQSIFAQSPLFGRDVDSSQAIEYFHPRDKNH
jgi:hypothetical protein